MIQLVYIFSFFTFIICNQECTNIKNLAKENVKFWLATSQDSNGQWIAETGVEHLKSSSVGWKVQVDRERSDCEGDRYCRMVATLSANCVSNPSRTTTKQLQNSDEDYVEYATGRYKLHDCLNTWDDAKAICESEGGYLAIINTQAEINVLKHVFQPSPSSYAFLGYTDREKEGEFVDIFGQPLIHNAEWNQDQPDNYLGDENCGSITHFGTLNDLLCSGKMSFICEKPL